MSDYSKHIEYRTRDVVRKCGFKAERVPLSGACHSIGMGDVNVEDGAILIDCKSTIGKTQITVKKADLEKINKQAEDGLGVLSISFKNCQTLYAVIPLETLLEIIKQQRVIMKK
jgi:Holliday junction resolvase